MGVDAPLLLRVVAPCCGAVAALRLLLLCDSVISPIGTSEGPAGALIPRIARAATRSSSHGDDRRNHVYIMSV